MPLNPSCRKRWVSLKLSLWKSLKGKCESSPSVTKLVRSEIRGAGKLNSLQEVYPVGYKPCFFNRAVRGRLKVNGTEVFDHPYLYEFAEA
jgi:hypothetical protein